MIDNTMVLNQLNATINQGDVIALLGKNGAGKTTLIETMLGFSLPSEGNISLFMNESKPGLNNETKQLIGYVPQKEDLLEFLTVESYLNSIASFYRNWNKDLINSLMISWNIPKDILIGKLSVGQKQVVSILAALGHEPILLILDEPASSLDPSARRDFLQALVEIQLKREISILFSTHIVSDVERVANRIWVMNAGQLIIDDTIDGLKEKSDQPLEDLFLRIDQ